MTFDESVQRALADLHDQLQAASKSIDRDDAGSFKSADQRIVLIERYAIAVERVFKLAQPQPHVGREKIL